MNILARTLLAACLTANLALQPARAAETADDLYDAFLTLLILGALLAPESDETAGDDDVPPKGLIPSDPEAFFSRLDELTTGTPNLDDAPTLARFLVTCNHDVKQGRTLVNFMRTALAFAPDALDEDGAEEDFEDTVRAFDTKITEAELACRKIRKAEADW